MDQPQQPQPQQRPPLQQPQQQQQPNQQQQQPHPNPNPHQHPHQPTQPNPYPTQLPAYYYRFPVPQQIPYHTSYPPQYAYQSWPNSANFASTATQPQPNVPQHTKPASQIINPGLTTDSRTHNQGLPPVTVANQTTPVAITRKRQPAILKDPNTKKELPLGDITTSVAKSTSAYIAKPSTATTTPVNNTTATVEHVHTLLQKVSEVETHIPGEAASEADTKTVASAATNDVASEVKARIPDEPVPKVETKNSEEIVSKVETSNTEEIDVSRVEPASPNEDVANEVAIETSKKENVPVTETNIQEEAVSEVDTCTPDEIVSEIETNTSVQVNGKESGDDSKNDDQESDSALTYEPGQYNPITKAGRKVYSRQFMLDVCTKICKLDLHKESEDKIGFDSSRLPSLLSERIDMFNPSYNSGNARYTPLSRQNEPSRRQSQHNYAGRSSAGQEKQRKIITSVSLTQEVELKTTSNPWRPTKDIKEDEAGTDEVETELLKKKFRSILNKLTPNNFENLAKAVTELHIDTESKLGEVIDIIFAKALAEPGYCVLYGQMCSHLKRNTVGAANFGNTLIRRCQHQFNADIYSGLDLNKRKEEIEKEEDPDIKKQRNEELYEEMYRCRMRSLGLIKFIGELYKIEMLNDAIMFDCVLRLLNDTAEESLECLCDLLATIGEKLDKSTLLRNNTEKEKKSSKSTSKANAYQGGQKSAAAVVASGSASSQKSTEQPPLTSIDEVFDKIHKIRKNKDLALSVRIRFKLLDTCELREKYNWQSKKTKEGNPKKIEEIREAHKEKLEQERRQLNAMPPRRSQEGRQGLGRHLVGSSSQMSLPHMHTSSSSHSLRDHDEQSEQQEHQKKLADVKGLGLLFKAQNANSNLSQPKSVPLRPSSGLYQRKS